MEVAAGIRETAARTPVLQQAGYIQLFADSISLYSAIEGSEVRKCSELHVADSTLSSSDNVASVDMTRPKVAFLELRKCQIKTSTCQPSDKSLQVVSASKLHTLSGDSP